MEWQLFWGLGRWGRMVQAADQAWGVGNWPGRVADLSSPIGLAGAQQRLREYSACLFQHRLALPLSNSVHSHLCFMYPAKIAGENTHLIADSYTCLTLRKVYYVQVDVGLQLKVLTIIFSFILHFKNLLYIFLTMSYEL